MNILIPLNSEYLINRYSMSRDFVFQIVNSIMPNLVDRLSSDGRVAKIDIMSNLDLGWLRSSSSKITVYKHDTGLSNQFYKIVSEYIHISNYDKEILVVYNPLFPFITVDKIYNGYSAIVDNLCNSAIGSYSNHHRLDNTDLASQYDYGILSIVRLRDFLRVKSRLCEPINFVNLDAINLVSLRNSSDHDLFELIVNSGVL